MKNLEDLAKFPSENPNPVLRVTKNKVLYVNKPGEVLFSLKEGDKIPELFQSKLIEALNKNILQTLEVEINNYDYILDIIPIKGEGYVNIYGKYITERKRAELKLKESEENYRTLIENAQEGIWTIDENSITSFVNPKMAEMLGYAQDEMLGKHLFDFMNERSIVIANRNLERRKQGIKEQHDFEFLNKNGTLIYAILETSPLMDEEGNYKGAVAFVTDITARKNAENEIVNLAKFPSENPNPVIRTTKELVIYSNQAGKNLFHCKEGDKVPQILQFEVNKAIDSNTNISIEVELKEKTYSFNIVSIKTEGYTNIYGRDITERKCAEIDLQKSEATYREAYQRAEFYKEIFTHDINNILQNISNGIQLNEMYLNKPEKLNAVKRNIEIIKKQVKRGAKLVSNVRKLSKISESENSLFIVKCNDVLAESVNYIKNAFNDKNIKIDVQISDTNLKILANELLEDVFENILTNSINYNDNELITINIKVFKELKQGINYIKFQFSDNGIGITDERKEQIFIRGFSEKTSVHGMGLGLSLVKKIIDSYTGEIWMEDRVKGDYTKGNSCLILIPEVVNNG